MGKQAMSLTHHSKECIEKFGEPCSDWQNGYDEGAKAQLFKSQQHRTNQFGKALEQARKGEPLDLSEEGFELFSAIQNDGTEKAYLKRLDRPELRDIEKILIDNLLCTVAGQGLAVYECDAKKVSPQILALIPDIEEAKKQRDIQWVKFLMHEKHYMGDIPPTNYGQALEEEK